MSLLDVSHQIHIYGGFIFIIAGLTGNFMNVLIFSSIRTYRTTPCTFYFLIHGLGSIAFLIINLPYRILSSGYGSDFLQTSSIWCKTRQYLIISIGSLIFTCSCLSTIDQYLSTSRNVYLRNLSNIKLAYRLILITLIVCCLHAIPGIFYFNIHPISNICAITNTIYAYYAIGYILGLNCIIPVLIMFLFGCLTYRNIRAVRHLVAQQTDRQLTKMTLFQIIVVIVTVTPYGIGFVYNLITSGTTKSSTRLQIESFISTQLDLLVYTFYVVCIT